MSIERTDLLKVKRGSVHYKTIVEDLPRLAIPVTRAVLDAAALGSGLEIDTIYWITDEQRLAIATAENAYTAMAKQSEAGGSGTPPSVVTLDFGSSPVYGKTFDVNHPGALTSQEVMAQISSDMPDGLSVDELEFDPIFCAAHVSAINTITISLTAVAGAVTGRRNVKYQIA